MVDEPRDETASEEPRDDLTNETDAEEELTEEQLRELLREQMERVTVGDMVEQMMLTLASVGYQKMGIPEVNAQFRDLAQARLAIDALAALLQAAEGKLDAAKLAPFQSTLANMRLNFVQAGK
ncbi:MAG: DUF1844 domain-containing protein [Candidatus Geothermincolia bacterium]